MTVDAAAGGALMNKTVDEAYVLIEDMAQNHYSWSNERLASKRPTGKYEIDAIDHLSSKVDALFQKLDKISVNAVGPSSNPCEICGTTGHMAAECQLGNSYFAGNEEVNALNNYSQQNNPFSNTYNPGWKNHPNFSYRPNPNTQPQNSFPQNNFRHPPGFQRPPPPPQKSNLEVMLENFIAAQNKQNEEFRAQHHSMNEAIKDLVSKVDSLATHNKMLETQIAQQASSTARSMGKLPGQPENPREHCNALVSVGEQWEEESEEFEEDPEEAEEETGSSEEEIREHESERCSDDTNLDDLPQKLKDPGSFTIPCSIGNTKFNEALCDLGASVSLMPLSVYKKFRAGELKPTNTTLHMADGHIAYPAGIFEDALVKVGTCYIPTDFVVLDMEEDRETPILLGRPFLATVDAVIQVKRSRLVFHIGEEIIEILPPTKKPSNEEICYEEHAFDQSEGEVEELSPIEPPDKKPTSSIRTISEDPKEEGDVTPMQESKLPPSNMKRYNKRKKRMRVKYPPAKIKRESFAFSPSSPQSNKVPN